MFLTTWALVDGAEWFLYFFSLFWWGRARKSGEYEVDE